MRILRCFLKSLIIFSHFRLISSLVLVKNLDPTLFAGLGWKLDCSLGSFTSPVKATAVSAATTVAALAARFASSSPACAASAVGAAVSAPVSAAGAAVSPPVSAVGAAVSPPVGQC